MGGPKRRSRFGEVLEEALQARCLRQINLAESLGVSGAYLSGLTTGSKSVTADRVTQVSSVLDLTPDEDRKLHRAAALDAGFRLDLPDDY